MAHRDLFDDQSSGTLLIPLIIRARESTRRNGLFHDHAAQDIVTKLPEDFFRFSVHPGMHCGTVVRVRFFDDLARNAIARWESPVVVQLGCGLDTRFSRIDEGKGIHVNIDLPDVMEMRQKILPSFGERCRDWSGSLLERDWMHRLREEYGTSRMMFIAEGVLMYLPGEAVRALIVDLAEHFPGSELVFDTTSESARRMLHKKSAIQELEASMHWIYDDDGSLEAWHPRLMRLEKSCYFDKFPTRWGLMSLMRFIPKFANMSSLYHFAVTP